MTSTAVTDTAGSPLLSVGSLALGEAGHRDVGTRRQPTERSTGRSCTLRPTPSTDWPATWVRQIPQPQPSVRMAAALRDI